MKDRIIKKKTKIIAVIVVSCGFLAAASVIFMRRGEEEYKGRLTSEQRDAIRLEIERRVADINPEELRELLSLRAGGGERMFRLRSTVINASPEEARDGLANAIDVKGLHDGVTVLTMLPTEYREVMTSTAAKVLRVAADNMTDQQVMELRDYQHSPEGKEKIEKWRRAYMTELSAEEMKAVMPIVHEINNILKMTR